MESVHVKRMELEEILDLDIDRSEVAN
jgi:hypothetical protein